ncbi:MAG: ABC transporter permease [Dehalococcoidia bacterium]
MNVTLIPSGRAWELLYLLTQRDLKLRYQDTALGFLWSMAKPLALGMVLYFALQKVVRIQVPDYHLVLLSGLFPWVWFQTSVFLATGAFAGNGALIKRVRFPKFVLPFSTILNTGIHFLLAIPILIILLGISGKAPSPTWLLGIPILVTIQLGLLMGVILFVASIDVYFRDLEHLTDVFLTLLFYSTPIIYPLSRVPDEWRWVVLMNPLASLIEGWRDLFLHNQLPGLDIWPAVVFAIGALLVGGLVFRRLEPGFVDAL